MSHEVMQAETGGKGNSAVDEAVDWLRETLSAGPVASEDVIEMAKGEGISGKTLRRAKKELGMGRGGRG